MTAPFKPASFNPHDPAFLANPYPTYAKFRAEAPVSWVTPYNTWWCFRYEDCQRILTGTDLFLKNNPVPDSGPPAPISGVLSSMPESVFSLDNPRHDQVRPILDGLFATAITDATPWAAGIAQQLLVAAKVSTQFELMNAYALPLPSGVLQKVLGVAPADFAGITNWVTAIVAANDITAPMSVRMGGLTCSMALNAYYQALGRCPMHNPTAMFDLMRDQGMKAPQGLSLDEVQTNAVTLSIAGYYSTTFLIGTGTLNLLNNPDQLALLRAKPELMPQAVTEMLRFDGPVQLINRYVAAETEIGGVKLKPGDVVTAVTGSANHDSAVYPDGDRFDITRTETNHQSFGAGIHRCLGAPLAERVAPVAFQVLLEQLPKLRLAGTPQWRTDPFLRSPSNLPIAWG